MKESKIQQRISVAVEGFVKSTDLLLKALERYADLNAELKQKVRTLEAELAARQPVPPSSQCEPEETRRHLARTAADRDSAGAG